MKIIEVSEETYEKIKDDLNDSEQVDISNYDGFVGKTVFFRTVTNYWVGKIVKRIGSIYQLEKASWIPDTGRFGECIKTGEFKEIEYVGNWNINFDSVVDFGMWKYSLPTNSK